MPSYTLQWSNPSKGTININPLTVDTSSTSLSLVGQGLTSYGQYEQQNFIRLLENFASTTAPANPTVGQFWFNTTTNTPMVYSTGNTWVNVGGAVISTTVPSNPNTGNTWFNTTNNSLYVYNGAAWERVLTVSSKVAAGIEAVLSIQSDLNKAPLGYSYFVTNVTACANVPSGLVCGTVQAFSTDGTNVPKNGSSVYQICYPTVTSSVSLLPYYRENVNNGGWTPWLQGASLSDLSNAFSNVASALVGTSSNYSVPIATNLNAPSLGISQYTPSTANTPITSTYGVCQTISANGGNNSSGTPGAGNWLFQLAYDTNGNMPYYRENINGGGWGNWQKIASEAFVNSSVTALNTTIQGQLTTMQNEINSIPLQYCYWSGQIGTMPFYYPSGGVSAGGCQGGINLRANFGVGTYKIVDNHYGTVFFIIVGDGYTEMVNNTNGLIQNSFFLFGGNDRVVSSGATYTTYASLQYTTYYSGNSISIYKLNISADMNNLAQLVGGAGLTGSSSISTLNDRVAALEAWQQTVISGGNSGG